ncbi:helix-turn-helix domain-containing protein [Streptomyces sp. SCSIO 30461]|uniref:helix-turn-helix domain-containing protein n=1 Tax=Streptomyces sp. SCSIO 30461 TaxID=3118085 RepID=UPI0030CEBBC7
MSRDAREWVWEDSRSRGTARLILLSIADRVADDQCVAWASLASLMERTNASRNAVRRALAALADSGELELLDRYEGPHRSSVYRLPLTAAYLAKLAAAREEDPDVDSVDPATASDPVPELDEGRLRRYGIRPKKGADSDPSRPNVTGADSDPSRQNRTPRRVRFRTPEGAVSDPQNQSEPKVNRRYSSSRAAAVTSASEWQPDPATHAWTQREGHLARLGEDGLAAADAKWRAHRADFKPRSADAWAADWRSWVAREHAPSRPKLYALPGSNDHSGASGPGRMTRAEAHTAALLAALEEPTGTE